jgi:hypothetical protein
MRERYALLQARHKDNVTFVCMYGFNTTLAEDVARGMKSHPGRRVESGGHPSPQALPRDDRFTTRQNR